MKFFSIASVIGCTLSFSMLIATTSVSAEPLHKSNYRHAVVHTHRVVNRAAIVRTPIRTVTTVSAFSLSRLPAGYVRFLHDDETFYYSEGVYYKKKSHGFVITKPRAGFRVATLPKGYRIIRNGNATFYNFNNVRYRKIDGFFIVV
jgi:hypothetical protein